MQADFLDFLMMCAGESEFIDQYNRLLGTTIGVDTRSPLDRMIDEATGYGQSFADEMEKQLPGFVSFCYDIYQRAPVECRQ